MKIKKITLILTTALMLFTGCNAGESQSSADNYGIDFDYDYSTEITTDSYDFGFDSAVDLIGQPIADIKASGFDYDLILNLAEYNLATAKPYTILVDGSSAFAAAVICKGDAVIANGIGTSVSMNDLGDIDINEDLGWSTAFQANFAPRLLTTSDGKEFDLRYMWRAPNPSNIFSVDMNAKSNCAFVYQNSYVYLPDYDFMWFNWKDNIYDVKASLIDKGFKVNEPEYMKNTISTESVSETLYGHKFYASFYYNDNMQLTSGEYNIYGTAAENADIYCNAVNDIIAKYGDSYKITMSSDYYSIDEALTYMRTDAEDYIYEKLFELYWNVNDHTMIKLTVDCKYIEIYYKSISSTGGTNLTEDLLL